MTLRQCLSNCDFLDILTVGKIITKFLLSFNFLFCKSKSELTSIDCIFKVMQLFFFDRIEIYMVKSIKKGRTSFLIFLKLQITKELISIFANMEKFLST